MDGDDRSERAVSSPEANMSRNGFAPAVTIVLADDHPVVRRGLRGLLGAEEGFEVVAEAGDVDTTLRKVRAYKPDVLVLDLNMPSGSSLEAIPALLEASPGTAIVVLTMEDEPESARAALRAGALAFALKDAADTELEQAVHAALSGHQYLNPRLGARVAADPEIASGVADHLSDRELAVLRLIAVGRTNTQIASELFLSVRTIESHRSNLRHKIGRASRAELVSYARDHGLFAECPDARLERRD
jgi:two-component system, NarL family, response regulator NreC